MQNEVNCYIGDLIDKYKTQNEEKSTQLCKSELDFAKDYILQVV